MFPSTFPSLAIQQVAKFVQRQDEDKARLALAVYEIAGYALFHVFKDARYVTSATPVSFKLTQQEIEEIIKDLPKLLPVALKFAELKGQGYGNAAIVFKLIMEFGPTVVFLVLDLWKKIKS